jgi:membrane protease YdiL (CAAX protease family)
MMKVAAFVKRHPILTYFTLAYGITWVGIALLLRLEGLRRGELGTGQVLAVWGLMLLGPGLAGPLLTGITEGRAGLRAFLGRMTRWRVRLRWYAPLLIVPALAAAVLGALSLASPDFAPGIVTADNRPLLLALLVAVAFGAGIEELGWTGFATPRLRLVHGVLAAGLILGVLWGGWHFLGDFSGSRGIYGALFPVHYLAFWIVPLVAFRVLMVWVYDHTGSLLLAQLLHASYTGTLVVLGPTGLTGTQSLLYEAIFAVMLSAIVALLVVPEAWRTVRPSLRAKPA